MARKVKDYYRRTLLHRQGFACYFCGASFMPTGDQKLSQMPAQKDVDTEAGLVIGCGPCAGARWQTKPFISRYGRGRKVRTFLAARDGWGCRYCGVDLQAPGQVATVDHVLAVSRGGDNSLSNKVLSCQPCNTAKASLDADDPVFVAFVELRRKVLEGAPVPVELSRGRKWEKKGYVHG